MSDEKAPEAPVEVPEAPVVESFIEKRRAEIENAVISENESFPEPETPEAPKEEKKEEKVSEEDSVEDKIRKVKEATQKRIDKIIAKSKSAEEELAEARAEIERLKAAPKPLEISTPKDDTPPTPEQVEAYIVRMREEGNVKEEVAATRYLIKLEKEMALKEITEKQNNAQKEIDANKTKIDSDMKALASDYVVYNDKGEPDPTSDFTLANKKGLLFRTALELYNDKDLHKIHYDDSNVAQGFRRAVADAYRELAQQGYMNAPKGEKIIPRTPKVSLADPDAVISEDEPSNSSSSLSDAEKVREEIKNRNKNRYLRRVPQ